MDPAKTRAITGKQTSSTIWTRNFICATAANLLFVMAHWSVNTLVAKYTTYLGATPVIMGLLTGMFFAISLAMRPVSGPMTTKVDKRKLMLAVYLLGFVVNLGYALFHSIPMFIVFRFLNGVQYSFLGSLVMTVAADSLPEEKMASGMGIYGVGSAIGTALGPAFSTKLLDWGTQFKNIDFGYTVVFLTAAVLQALALIPSVLLHPDRKTKEDVASTGAWYKNILTVHALPATLVLFFAIIGYAVINNYIVNFGDETKIGGISLFFTLMALTLILSRPLSGYLSDRLGVAKVIIPGLIMFAGAFLIIGFSSTLTTVLIGSVVAALGIGSTQPALQAMSIQSVAPLKRSVASNTIYVGMDLGFFFGPLLGGIVYEKSSYAFMFKMTAVPVLLGLVCFIAILPVYTKRRRALEESKVS